MLIWSTFTIVDNSYKVLFRSKAAIDRSQPNFSKSFSVPSFSLRCLFSSNKKNKMSDLENEAKKVKIEDDQGLRNVLNDFEFVQVLNENKLGKLIIAHAVKKSASKEEENRDAIFIFEKPHFGLEETKSFLDKPYPTATQIENNIYTKLSLYPKMPFNNVEVQMIYPATKAHFAKYSTQECFVLVESYRDWLEITSKCIANSSLDLQWVFNILEHKTESERIVFEDEDPVNGFILLPDMKWDGKIENLYLLAIVHQRNLPSLRELNREHIALLENVRDKSLKAIEKNYELKPSKVKAFIHYRPSFYHFHVHFTHMSNQTHAFSDRNHLLTHVIDNLNIDSDFYRKTSLEFIVKKNEPLYEFYKERFE